MIQTSSLVHPPDLGLRVMKQRWRDVLFLHWPVAPEVVQPLLPPGLIVETFGGNAYVGLVPFSMEGVRPVGFPAVPGLSDFHETNVRTYVRTENGDSGVWFFSLDAANRIAVGIARSLWSLPYFFAEMNVEVSGNHLAYRSQREGMGSRSHVEATFAGVPHSATPGTLEHFLVERYRLFAYRQGRLYSGWVRHDPYRFVPAEVTKLEEDLVSAAGLPSPTSKPLAHYVVGVDVDIFPLRKYRPRRHTA